MAKRQPTKSSPSKATKSTSTASLLSTAIIMLVSGMGGVEVISALCKKHKITKSEAEAIIKEAKEKITTASTVSAREELGFSIESLKKLYRESLEARDYKTALSVVKEKNRLLNLYDSDDLELVSESAKTRTEELVRQHLEPLLIGLGIIKKQDEPLEELARLASSYIVNNIKKTE